MAEMLKPLTAATAVSRRRARTFIVDEWLFWCWIFLFLLVDRDRFPFLFSFQFVVLPALSVRLDVPSFFHSLLVFLSFLLPFSLWLVAALALLVVVVVVTTILDHGGKNNTYVRARGTT